MPYVATSAGRQMRTFYPPPYGFAAPRVVTRRAFVRGLGQVSATGAAASVLGSIAPFTGPAAPFVALGATLTALFGQMFSGCGQTCTLTSDKANQMENFLKQNLTLYQQSGHTQSEQAAALQNFNDFWNQLVQFCSQPSMGSAGQRCITDRQAGSCKWQNANGCWNWWIGYHDPIANDPNVVPDPVAPQSYTTLTPAGTVATATTPAGGSSAATTLLGGFTLSPVLIGGGILALGLIFFLGGD